MHMSSITSWFCVLHHLLSHWLLLRHLVGAQRPSYPSSKPRKVDWEKLEAEVKKEVRLLANIRVIESR